MSKVAVTRIPGRPDIELPAFYESFEWYYPNCELQTKEWFVSNAQPDWVYIDCGANIGYYSILFCQLSPSGFVHAIEPTITADMLFLNLEHNKAKNVEIHRIAVGDCTGPKKDKVYRIWGEAPEEYEYEFITVDQLVLEAGIGQLHCIKIDVDSFDFEVLKGAEKTIQQFDPWIVIELSNSLALRNSSTAEVLGWLRDRGYKTARILDKENYVFKRMKPEDHPAEIPIESICWLNEKDTLLDVVAKLPNASPDVPWANNSYVVECLVSSARSIELVAEFQKWSIPSKVYAEWQGFQYAAFAKTFSPDCVLQFGRWGGEFTFALITGMNCSADSRKNRFWSFCESTLWNNGPIYEKLLENLGPDWLRKANLVTRLPTQFELEEIVKPAKRVLVFWNDPSREAGDIILSRLMPLIHCKHHAVIVHGISDGRFGTVPGYDGECANMLVLGDLWSARTDLPRIVDFVTRNNAALLSAERAFRKQIDTQGELARELGSLLGPFFSTSAGWHWFTLNGHAAPIFFPQR
jgi:FkbM family methyltransferase